METATPQLAPTVRRRSAGVTVIRSIVWLGALIAAGFGCMEGFNTLINAESAPQQAAGSAMALVIIIGPYVIARAISELLE